jgi:hypothetical protein
MDHELAKSLRTYCAAHSKLAILEIEETNSLRVTIARRFGFELEQIWWWEHVPREHVCVSYTNQDGLDFLASTLSATTDPLLLFVTDDNPAPWMCISGDGNSLIEMLREQRFFEYFIVNRDLGWVLFDTHQNAMMLVGDGLTIAPPRQSVETPR